MLEEVRRILLELRSMGSYVASNEEQSLIREMLHKANRASCGCPNDNVSFSEEELQKLKEIRARQDDICTAFQLL